MKIVFTLIISALILSGCSNQQTAVIQPASLNLNWQQHVQNIKSIQGWNASAQVAIKVNNKTQKAKMTWQQNLQNYQIAFFGPFGQSGPKLKGNEKSATLLIPKEPPISGTNTSALLQQRLGWQLPVNNAKYWMLGIPAPSTESRVSLQDERLATLVQDGWTINYSKYKQFGRFSLPTKILITRPDLNLLMVVYRWNTAEQQLSAL
jgi:outer membrane lipoprotein LolB